MYGHYPIMTFIMYHISYIMWQDIIHRRCRRQEAEGTPVPAPLPQWAVSVSTVTAVTAIPFLHSTQHNAQHTAEYRYKCVKQILAVADRHPMSEEAGDSWG